MQKGFAQTLLLFFVVFAFIIGVVYLFVFNNQFLPQDKLVPPTEEKMPETIYEDESLGFRFSVPDSYWVIEESEEQFHTRSNGNMRKNFASTLFYQPAGFVSSLYLVNSDNGQDTAALSIWVFENPDSLNAEAFYKKYWYYPFIWGDFTYAKNKIAPTEKIMIDEATASASIVDYQPNSPQFIYLPKGDKMYLFKVIDTDQVLKSFKFTP